MKSAHVETPGGRLHLLLAKKERAQRTGAEVVYLL